VGWKSSSRQALHMITPRVGEHGRCMTCETSQVSTCTSCGEFFGSTFTQDGLSNARLQLGGHCLRTSTLRIVLSTQSRDVALALACTAHVNGNTVSARAQRAMRLTESRVRCDTIGAHSRPAHSRSQQRAITIRSSCHLRRRRTPCSHALCRSRCRSRSRSHSMDTIAGMCSSRNATCCSRWHKQSSRSS
jgi:hypothetical protein